MDSGGESPGDDHLWDGLVGRVRAAVAAAVPEGVPVLVVADGFSPLLQHAGRRAGNFPQDGSGNPAHHRLPDDQRATWHLEALRAKGFEALVLPETGRWWLDHYAALRLHLDGRYTTVWDDDDCRIYDVRERHPEWPGVADFVASFEAHHGRPPSVLDWDTGAGLVDRLDDAPVVSVGALPRLPYIDQSLDLVVVGDGAGPMVVAEARRVATSAVVRLSGRAEDVGPRVLWPPDTEEVATRAAVVVDLGADPGNPAAHLRAITDAVPPGVADQLVVLTDAGITAEGDERVQIRPRNGGGLEGLLTVAEQTEAAVLVLLGPLALPAEGCVAALLRTLAARPDAVAVCGCLVDPVGSLLAAGGVVLADGDVLGFGEPGEDAFLPLYRYVRPVAVCTPPVLALRREALSPPLDLRLFESAEAKHAALSLALRHRGGVLLYQPEAVVADLRSALGLRPVPPADRERLRAASPSLVAAGPAGRDGLTWYDLAAMADLAPTSARRPGWVGAGGRR